jgi:hypothetical protein
MTVQTNATNSFDIGTYPMRLYLTDDIVTGRAGSTITWIGNATYYFTLTIDPRPGVVYETPIDERLEQVFESYSTNVIDVRTFDRNAMLNANDNTVIVNPQPKFADP